MRIKKIVVKNFRLLQDVTLTLEDKTTVIVGRNNSGKTSLTELFRRLLSDSSPKFILEDFSMVTHEAFWDAFKYYIESEEKDEVRSKLPTIEVMIFFTYDENDEEFGSLSEFVIDLDVNTKEAIASICYCLKDGKIKALFDGCSFSKDIVIDKQKLSFYKLMQERIPKLYEVAIMAIDPTDYANRKKMDISSLRTLLQSNFINAQRGLDDTTYKEKDVLGKILTKLFACAMEETAATKDRDITIKLDEMMTGIQEKINTDYNKQIIKLIPTLELFGYPGLNDPKIHTETLLDAQSLLEAHTRIRYEGANGIGLPETYNGLGSRNLIYILLELYQFFKSFQIRNQSAGVHLIFIEEPEAHLHPQMQEVFIRQISKIVKIFEEEFNNDQPWPVQFIITTHSTHMANEAQFESIRYFFISRDNDKYTCIKDLGEGLSDSSYDEDKEFLHKYMTLTRCDLFFADKAILVEGPTERILMPKMIEKVDEISELKLSSQYISLIEVGGAYAHHFYKLLDFLEIRALIITDIDTVKQGLSESGKTVYCACKTNEGTHTSNAGIKNWFLDLQSETVDADDDNESTSVIELSEIVSKTDSEKVINLRRIAYQVPEEYLSVFGRSFEDAFMLANLSIFNIEGETDIKKVDAAYKKAQKVEKTNFALKYALDITSWQVPRYIKEGLLWLAENNKNLPYQEELHESKKGSCGSGGIYTMINQNISLNPAELAAREALEQVFKCIKEHKSFIFEAGAGAGKTYSLIQCIKHIIESKEYDLLRRNQHIACITYTNVAKDEIKNRTDSHPLVLSETIHSFCWSILKDFQQDLRDFLPSIGHWPERISSSNDIEKKTVLYDLGYPSIDDSEIKLEHDDVVALMVKLMEKEKFRMIFSMRFPILFIDEYQDTNKDFVNSLIKFFIETGKGPLIGFFGDHWQKIYGSASCGKIEHRSLISIGKKANFRSEKVIVDSLNRMRPELPQHEYDSSSKGVITIYHTNSWQGERRTGAHWEGDLPPENAHLYLEYIKKRLTENDWDFAADKTKVLMLTHNVLADEQGYRNLADVFPRTEAYIKKENPYIAFFADLLEPACDAYLQRMYGEMFYILGDRTPKIHKHVDKIQWAKDMESLIGVRCTGTIRQVIDLLKETKHPRLSEKVEASERKYEGLLKKDEKTEQDKRFIERMQNLEKVFYSEVVALVNFINDKTPFATNHGVKGAEFENVLVVVGRGWNQYNFGQMLEWVNNGVPKGKQDSYERNRNLFYVACSRPKKRLALLFTQKLSSSAIETLNRWYGEDRVVPLPNI